ncbi:A24 family peptidase [Blastopirellula sp. JC732]|uniref:A24 family peptidase n=1 Tax=Blastopirellula sediminis TaxID=2894196 RepID=A0A9X1MLW6_9BACT|nr:A24 family peptidase [Blastopirellula sediminis]MCC9608588.1 A24 family peptidase [Blastopirellula sediminis]MCC9628635.1 A24 family peptidase [Blastopirellula sediminis]
MSSETANAANDLPERSNRLATLWRIGWLLPAVALAVAATLTLVPLQGGWKTGGGLMLLIAVAIAAFTDIRQRRIYNWLTYPLFLWALGLNLVASIGWPQEGTAAFAFTEAIPVGPAALGAIGIGQSLSGAATCFTILLVAYLLSGGGAGDVKIAACIGACLGMRAGLFALITCYLAAAAVCVVWSMWKHGPVKIGVGFARKAAAILIPGFVAPPDQDQTLLLEKPVPLGPFFALGSIVALSGVIS